MQATKTAWLENGSRNCYTLQTAAWKCLTQLETEMNTRSGQMVKYLDGIQQFGVPG